MNPDELNFHKDILQKELDLIQEIIKRMASNSFQVKAWTITLFSALVVLMLEKFTTPNPILGIFISLLLCVPIVCFWYLDAFFLSTERLYRQLYHWVVQYRMLNQDNYLYDLNTFTRYTKTTADGEVKEASITNKGIFFDSSVSITTLQIMMSKTLLGFYLIPLLFILLLFAYQVYKMVTGV